MAMTTTANLLIGTGIIHPSLGLKDSVLCNPLLRAIRDVAIQVADLNERYARICSFWYQIVGVMMIMMGCCIRSNGAKEPPKWFGWTLTTMGLVGGILMPTSGSF